MRRALGLFLLCALAGASSSYAYRVRLNPGDQARARFALPRLADMPRGWTEMRRGPGVGKPITCPDFKPKDSDLTLTGKAIDVFQRVGVGAVTGDVKILASARMVTLDLRRTFVHGFLACNRSYMQSESPSSVTVLPGKRLLFPSVAGVTVAYRFPWDQRATNGRVYRGVTDMIFLVRGRGEAQLSFSGPLGLRGTASTIATAKAIDGFERFLAAAVDRRMPTT